MLTRRGVWLLYTTSTVAFLAFFSMNPMFTAASLTLLLLYVLELLQFRRKLALASDLDMRREVHPEQVFVDEKVSVKLSVKNRRKWGLDTVKISDGLPETFAVQSGSVSTLIKVPRGQTALVDYVARAMQMGGQIFETVKIEIVDFLGLFYGKVTIPLRSQVAVYPRVRLLNLMRAHSPRAVVHMSSFGERTFNLPGRGSEFHGIREYSPGDDFKSISWKAMARSPNHTLMTKEFEADRSLNIVVALHCTRTLAEGSIGARKLDVAVEAILSLSNLAVHEGDHLTFLFHEERKRFAVPRRGRHSQAFQATKSLYNLKLGSVEKLSDVISKLLQETDQRSVVFLLTDEIVPEAIPTESIRELLLNSRRVQFLFLQTSSFLPVPAKVTWQARDSYEYLLQREEKDLATVLAMCRAVGIEVAVCGPISTSSRMIDTYLRAKRRGMIAA